MIEGWINRIREQMTLNDQLRNVRSQIDPLMNQIFDEYLVTEYSYKFNDGLESWEKDFLNLLIFNPELSGKKMGGISVRKSESFYPDRGFQYETAIWFGNASKLIRSSVWPDSYIWLDYLPKKSEIHSEISISDNSKISKTDVDPQREFFRLDLIKEAALKVVVLKSQPQHQTEQIPNN